MISATMIVVFVTGIQTSQDAHFYGRAASFDKFTNKDKTVVIQFTVKHEQKIDCGGGYVKVRKEFSRCVTNVVGVPGISLDIYKAIKQLQCSTQRQ